MKTNFLCCKNSFDFRTSFVPKKTSFAFSLLPSKALILRGMPYTQNGCRKCKSPRAFVKDTKISFFAASFTSDFVRIKIRAYHG
jgi:hypothetical protein